jgi:hypothetical protein
MIRMTTALNLASVIKGKKVQADRSDVSVLLHSYRIAKAGQKAAGEAADAARDGLISLVGDGEVLTDAVTGLTLCSLPVRSRTNAPSVAALLAEFEDMPAVQERIKALVPDPTLYRAVAK